MQATQKFFGTGSLDGNLGPESPHIYTASNGHLPPNLQSMMLSTHGAHRSYSPMVSSQFSTVMRNSVYTVTGVKSETETSEGEPHM